MFYWPKLLDFLVSCSIENINVMYEIEFQRKDFYVFLCTIIGTLIVTCYAIPWILLIVVPLLLVCNNIQEYYRHTARQLRRLSSISFSPVYAHFSETLKGLVTIRAMKAVRR